jgi:hypothetical protein
MRSETMTAPIAHLADGTPVQPFHSPESGALLSFEVDYCGGLNVWVAQHPLPEPEIGILFGQHALTLTPAQYQALRAAILADVGGQLLELWQSRTA